MSDHNALRARAYEALAALPRPITQENALLTVKPILPAKEYADFAKWFDRNGAAFLEKLNG